MGAGRSYDQSSDQATVTDQVGAFYLMNVITADAAGGVDAERLASDAVAAQRGDRSAFLRLRRVMGPEPVAVVSVAPCQPRRAPRRSSAQGRRRSRRARSPSRSLSEVPLEATRALQARNAGWGR